MRPTLTPLARSLGGEGLGDNQLCGIGVFGYGTYTTEAIPELCKGLRDSAITSLECAAAP